MHRRGIRADEAEAHETDPPLAVHLVPFDGIGGVEVAARTTPDAALPQFHFRKLYLLDAPYIAANAQNAATTPPRRVLDHPRVYWDALQRLRSLGPRLVIASLWRSCAVAIVLKLVQPSTKVVTFLHVATDVHLADKWLNTIAMWLSTEIWADSQATLDARVSRATSTARTSRTIAAICVLGPTPSTKRARARTSTFCTHSCAASRR